MALRLYFRESLKVAGIMSGGDLIAQFVIERRSFKDWNHWRTIRFGAVGLIVVGPVLKKWYTTLERIVPTEQKSPVHRGIKKMLYDQLLFAPIFTLALSFLIPCVNGEPLNEVTERVKRDYYTIMSRNYMLWPAAQIINFAYIPLQYQVLYAQCVALMWNCYLATMLN